MANHDQTTDEERTHSLAARTPPEGVPFAPTGQEGDLIAPIQRALDRLHRQFAPQPEVCRY